MDQFDDWLQRVSEGKIDGTLQSEIADKILELLEQKKASVTAQEKKLFAQAITGLSINVNSINPTEVGLRRCLIALQVTTNSENQPDESCALIDNDDEFIDFATLVSTVQRLKGQIFKETKIFLISAE